MRADGRWLGCRRVEQWHVSVKFNHSLSKRGRKHMDGKHIIGQRTQTATQNYFHPPFTAHTRPPAARQRRSVRPLLLLISDQSSLMTSWSLSDPALSLLSFQHSLHDQHAGLRHPDAAAVPSAGEEPGHSRLPAQQATLLLGVAQLPPVSLMHLATTGAPCGHSTSALTLSRVHMCGRVQGTECFL